MERLPREIVLVVAGFLDMYSLGTLVPRKVNLDFYIGRWHLCSKQYKTLLSPDVVRRRRIYGLLRSFAKVVIVKILNTYFSFKEWKHNRDWTKRHNNWNNYNEGVDLLKLRLTHESTYMCTIRVSRSVLPDAVYSSIHIARHRDFKLNVLEGCRTYLYV